jgi:hypothetical protein
MRSIGHQVLQRATTQMLEQHVTLLLGIDVLACDEEGHERVISGHQRSLAVIRDHQMSSTAISAQKHS